MLNKEMRDIVYKEMLDTIYDVCNIGIFTDFDKRELIIKVSSNRVNIPMNEIMDKIYDDILAKAMEVTPNMLNSDVLVSVNFTDIVGGAALEVGVDIAGEVANFVNYLTCKTKDITPPPEYEFNADVYNPLVSSLKEIKQYMLKSLKGISVVK